jgi:ribonuclease HIII
MSNKLQAKVDMLREFVAKKGLAIKDDIAVVAASIIAQAEFVGRMQYLSKEVGIQLPFGASDPKIVTTGREIVAKSGKEVLKNYAKLHFQTTKAILQE